MSEISVRDARPEDAAAVADIFLAARRKAMAYLPVLHTEREVRDWIANVVLSLKSGFVWVAERDGEVVGFLALDGENLDHLYVRPDAQGRGVGSALIEKAKAANPARLSLYAFQKNRRARRFYEARNFKAVEFGDGSGNEEGEPDVKYEWSSAPRAKAL